MKQLLVLFLITSSLVSVTWADTRTVKLAIPSMNCAMCPFTVRKALERVDGVKHADVEYETKLAVVVYDDQKTSVDLLTKATHDAGYPSTVVKKD